MYHVEVKTASMPVSKWLREYCQPDRFTEECRACPNYGKNWACPPGVPEAPRLLRPLRTVHLVGMKVVYDPDTRAAATSPEETERLRRATYGVAKKRLMGALLALQKLTPGSYVVAAGCCEWCERCARLEGQSCRQPEKCRYSFSGLGFDLNRIAVEALDIPLLWPEQGLGEYDVAMAAFVEP